MIQFWIDKINDHELPAGISGSTTNEKILKIIDLGTGNGHLLFQMHEDFEEELDADLAFEFTGIDYSPDSVAFAQKIHSKKYQNDSDCQFMFAQVDILQQNNDFLSTNEGLFDILLDKGTLDAIALNQDPLPDFDNKIGMEVYALQVSKLMHKDSILLITSCNFTETELTKIITQDTTLKVWDQINYPSFEFGGKKGSAICSIAFIKE